MKTSTAVRRLALVLAVVVGFGLALSGAAAARPDTASSAASRVEVQPLGGQICDTPAEQVAACGRVVNASGTAIVAYKDRCSGSNPCGGSHQWRLTRGQATPAHEDWDLAWLPCRSFGFKNYAGGTSIPWTGGGGFHIVHDPETLTIVSTTC